MRCENCGLEHDGKYGSGRFCGKVCARSFSSKEKREEINAKVSKKLKGRRPAHGKGFKKGYDPNRRPFNENDRKRALKISAERRANLYKILPWEELPLAEKKRRIKAEQGEKCLCGISQWNGKPLVLELHHEDGNNKNNSRNNLVMLCPNCHSMTDNYKNKKREQRSGSPTGRRR